MHHGDVVYLDYAQHIIFIPDTAGYLFWSKLLLLLWLLLLLFFDGWVGIRWVVTVMRRPFVWIDYGHVFFGG